MLGGELRVGGTLIDATGGICGLAAAGGRTIIQIVIEHQRLTV